MAGNRVNTLIWSHKNNKCGEVPDQTTESDDSKCVYLGDLQQYNTVLDGLYHALKDKDRKRVQ